MRYKDGDTVVVSFGGQLRYARIMGVKPTRGLYLISVDHGSGGFHYVPEEDLNPVDQVNPSDVYTLSTRVPSWHGEVQPNGN